VPTLKGNTVIKIPPGTQQDKTLRIKGLGIPSLKGHSTGDQLFVIKIQIPTKLTAHQKELLKEFGKESGMSMEEDSDGFFDKMKTFFEWRPRFPHYVHVLRRPLRHHSPHDPHNR